MFHNGLYFSTLTDVDFGSLSRSCQVNAIKIPSGWEIAPSTKDVMLNVVRTAFWGADLLVLANGDAVVTKSGQAPGFVYKTKKLQSGYDGYKPTDCYDGSSNILIRTCRPGTFYSNSSTSCRLCSAGKYSSSIGAT
jgi:hypothetical protein